MSNSHIFKSVGVQIISVTQTGIQIPNGDKKYGRIAVTPPAGYTAVGIAGWYLDGDYASFLPPLQLLISSGQVSWGFRNVATSGTSNATLNVYVLCVKQ